MLLYTQCFFYSSQINTKRLEKNSFSQYSLSKQLRMICIFIQDQSRLMKEQLDREKGKKSYNTGMEMSIANRQVDHSPQEKISFSDNYEGMLECFDTIIHFVYYSTGIVSNLISVYKNLTKKYYFECQFDGITIDDLINMYEFLYTYSQIYMKSVLEHFDQENYSEYKYMVPVVSLEYLIKQFVLLYGYEKNLAKKLLDNFVFNEHLRKEEGDIFSRPLLKVNENQVLLCESLIEQINLERNVEQWLKKYDVDLFPVGFQFENKLREKIGSINGIEVNSNKFTFTAYDGKDVEFDVFCDNIEADVLSYL